MGGGMGHVGETVRDWLALPSTIVAIVLLVVGLIVVGMESQTQNWVYYTGDRVTGTVEGGIVYYTVAGQQYTQDDPAPVQPRNGTKISVYYHHGDPSDALLEHPVRTVELWGMLSWFVAAGLLVVAAALRRAWFARRRSSQAPADPRWWPTGESR